MDPNETLKQILAIAERILEREDKLLKMEEIPPIEHEDDHDDRMNTLVHENASDAVLLADGFMNLMSWIAKGGFLPDALKLNPSGLGEEAMIVILKERLAHPHAGAVELNPHTLLPMLVKMLERAYRVPAGA